MISIKGGCGGGGGGGCERGGGGAGGRRWSPSAVVAAAALLAGAAVVCVGLLAGATAGSGSSRAGAAKLLLEQRRSLPPLLPLSGAAARATHVVSWDGKLYRIVAEGVCDDTTLLRPLKGLAESPVRLSPSAESEYRAAVLANGSIEGWLEPEHVQYVKSLTQEQHARGIYGSVGEIGVYRGKFFIALAGFAKVDEPMFAVDLFDDLKKLNVDGSGWAVSKSRFLENLERFGIQTGHIRMLQGDSNTVTVKNFTSKSSPQFRLISVDGSHTLEATLHDLTLASCIIREGGIVVVDDVTNVKWLGAWQAVVHFVTQGTLYPFLLAQNKIYMTTRSYHSTYLESVRKSSEFPCQQVHLSRKSLNDIEMCVIGE